VTDRASTSATSNFGDEENPLDQNRSDGAPGGRHRGRRAAARLRFYAGSRTIQPGSRSADRAGGLGRRSGYDGPDYEATAFSHAARGVPVALVRAACLTGSFGLDLASNGCVVENVARQPRPSYWVNCRS